MADIIQIRRDTSSNWTSVNPTLAQGELGVETNTSKIKIGDGTTTWNSLAYLIDPSTFISTTGVQTLTNKTISADDNTLSGLAASSFVLSDSSGNIDGTAAQKVIPSGAVVGTSDTQTLTNKTLTVPTFTGYFETVFTITDGASVDLDPANGTVQVWVLGASRTPTATNFAAGESMTLMIDDGSAYSITWPSVTWVGGAAPTLATTGYTVVELWKVSSTLYGSLVGNV